MASSAIKPGILVALHELEPSSPFFKQGASLRVTGRLQGYSVETGIATIIDGGASLKIDIQQLADIGFRIGSIYQFIGNLASTSWKERGWPRSEPLLSIHGDSPAV